LRNKEELALSRINKGAVPCSALSREEIVGERRGERREREERRGEKRGGECTTTQTDKCYGKSALCLVHPAHQSIYLIFSVPIVSSFTEMVALFCETAPWIGKFEWPQEFVRLFEVRSHSVKLVY